LASRRDATLLLALAAVLAAGYAAATRHGPALADEYIYLAGARHFAETGRLDARYYDASAILKVGHPHQDAHSPGYAIVLGAAIAPARVVLGNAATTVRGLYWTAVALNALAWLGMAWLARALALGLGLTPPAALVSGALLLLLPALLPYVFWSMPEVLVPAALLASLTLAVRRGDRLGGVVGAALLSGLAFLLRETSLFGLPAVIAALWGWPRRGRNLAVFAATLIAFLVLVHAPLSARRPAGIRFWELPWGHPAAVKADSPPSGGEMVHALRRGDVVSVLDMARRRATWNVRDLASLNVSRTERGILALQGLLPLLALIHFRSLSPLARRVLLGSSLGFAALTVVLFCAYTVGLWGGFRYLMPLMPAFLPFVAAGVSQGVRGAAPAALVALASVALDASTLGTLTAYKISRQKRQAGIDEYVARFVPAPGERIALPNGWLYGLERYPVEVISSVPTTGGQLHRLERAIWFDYLVLPGDSSLARKLDSRVYQRMNPGEDPPLYVFRRQDSPTVVPP
jgi:hypothetical protein